MPRRSVGSRRSRPRSSSTRWHRAPTPADVSDRPTPSPKPEPAPGDARLSGADRRGGSRVDGPPAGHLDRQPEGRRRQDDHRREPRRRARRARTSGCWSSTSTPRATRRPGMGISHRNVEGSIYDVIMNDAPVDDCVEPTSVQEPLRGPGHHRPRRRRDRAGPGLLPRAEAAPGARTSAATTTTSSSSTARPRSGSSPSTGWRRPTT